MVAPDLHLERPRRGSNRERRTSRGPGRPGLLNVYPRQPEGASLCCSQYLAVAVSVPERPPGLARRSTSECLITASLLQLVRAGVG